MAEDIKKTELILFLGDHFVLRWLSRPHEGAFSAGCPSVCVSPAEPAAAEAVVVRRRLWGQS